MMIFTITSIFIVLSLPTLNANQSARVDENGYVLYCPCMGRFGNQADHFLGVLSFSKGLNRTLVLPPWIEYVPGHAMSKQIPFDTYFKVASLQKYHRVMLMHDFMADIAPSIWPPAKRTVLCYMARHSSEGCSAKEGNPFGPFWDHFAVDFSNSSFYGPLHYDMHYGDMAREWGEKYSPQEWPVLAFTGAPAAFPVQKENTALHEFLEWNDDIIAKAKEVINSFPRGPFVGIHLRNGPDWKRACEHVKQSPNLFAAPQCLGYVNEHGKATPDLCLPPLTTIVRQVKRAVKSVGANTLFVASDHHHMEAELSKALRKMKVAVKTSNGAGPHVDLAVLGLSNHFIGNCISSFTAFAKRERDVFGLPSSFWAFPVPKQPKHSEL